MAGYGSRKAPADGKVTELKGKALALEDAAGHTALILTLDLVGIDREQSQMLCRRIAERHGLERPQIAICTSHTHSGPVVGRNLGPLHYWSVDDAQKKSIDDYAAVLLEKLVALAGEALAARAPARLQWGGGKATFAVNRRENKPYDAVPERREHGDLAGPVDHDVPVLSVRDPEGNLKAVLFGYACHATVLSANQWNADYPGYAQAAVEAAHPGSVALFWAGCGGDQNPLPRGEVALAEAYGAELAESVEEVLDAPMEILAPRLDTRYREIPAPLAEVPTRDQLEATAASTNRFEVARARLLLRQLEKRGALDGGYPYPVSAWLFGDGQVEWIALGGEVVVDYARRLKAERLAQRTWVAGYSHDVMAYIPSLRVLREGGYEGGGSNVYYGLPALWGEAIEETIVKAAHDLAGAPTAAAAAAAKNKAFRFKDRRLNRSADALGLGP